MIFLTSSLNLSVFVEFVIFSTKTTLFTAFQVLTEDVMNGYNKLFNSLWRTKRIEIILSTLWKNQTVLFKYLRLIPGNPWNLLYDKKMTSYNHYKLIPFHY